MKIITSLLAVFLIIVFLAYAVTPHSAELTALQTNNTNDLQVEASSATNHLDSIVLGAGCFWGAEKRYQAIPGVLDAVSGYADGKKVRPNYREITKSNNKYNENNHAEVVKVTYNKSMVSLETILQNYFEGHDPTQLNRQGNDVGTQYRSTILTNSKKQLMLANKVIAEYQTLLLAADYGKVVTKTADLKEFFPAEEYHQDYLVKNPNGYCPNNSTGVKFNSQEIEKRIVDNSNLMSGKQIIIIESENHCPYCEKFKDDVVKAYQGTVPMSFRLASQLKGLKIKTPTWATPTILFLEDGKEVFGKQGYMKPIDFYKALGLFKLGKSEAFKVAFDEATDSRFCKQYEIFKNTPDGVFIDKLSGEPLFDTRDRFNSKTGWLSFTKAIDGSTVEKPDHRYGMRRIEVRSKTSNIHLGHVFPDGPNGQSRFCINATVLEFKPRAGNAI
ncbi:MAG: peptide methionine sulfoxide reductase msrA/msrB [Polaribacter sp.]|jgi:peptide methionine sulfoxide reductase msrA/msrB